jgi:hypothetical protein
VPARIQIEAEKKRLSQLMHICHSKNLQGRLSTHFRGQAGKKKNFFTDGKYFVDT